MTTTVEDFSELGQEVPFAQVDRELKKFFQSDRAVTRASLMNFAIYSQRPEALAENSKIIREVTREHACRALLISHEPGDEVSVRTWVTAHCNVAKGGVKSICSEQIAMRITGQSASLIPNTVFARLDSDLPLVFWWQGDFTRDFEPALYSRIDRLIIDSGSWEDPKAQFDRLERAYREPTTRFNVMDLAWTRVLQLRLAFAACFDDPAALAALPGIHTVKIHHGQSHTLVAKMFAAWVARQAGWKFVASESAKKDHFLFETSTDKPVAIEFYIDSAHDVPPTKIQVLSQNASWEVIREPDLPFFRTLCRVNGGCIEHLTPNTLNTCAELVVERLRRGCNTKLYFELLGVTRQML